MGKMIQIRHVSDDLHRRLKARAAMEGTTLSEYLAREVAKIVERPSPEELRARISRRQPVTPRHSPAAVLREERESR
jgi:plasmid stability protein